MITQSPISLDAVRAQFAALLSAAGTSLEAPALAQTWRAFREFSQIAVACDEESLFFECGLSPSNEDCFYVNFTRTFFGRDAGNHFWSNEVNCDFLFQCDEILEEIGATVEAEVESAGERDAFFRAADAQMVWQLLEGHAPLGATIYSGES